jgi:hypothetical protein
MSSQNPLVDAEHCYACDYALRLPIVDNGRVLRVDAGAEFYRELGVA